MTPEWFFGALVAAAYLVIAVLTWRRAAWFFADKARYEPEERFSSFEIIWGLVVGAAFAAVWPLTLAVWFSATRGIPYVGSRFLLPPDHIRHEQRATESAQQEHRIAELERQVEIR
jgi:hypothetical protein